MRVLCRPVILNFFKTEGKLNVTYDIVGRKFINREKCIETSWSFINKTTPNFLL
jgi:hypothetical protein